MKIKICIRCGQSPVRGEKSFGCFLYGKKMANRHLFQDIKTWPEIREQLLEVQKFLQGQNGTESCKNCGIDPEILISQIEPILTPLIIK